eukprot:CAMPEP_0198335748 /NCGR_PEP_ID=MMETSP1450-20131203/20525_1 /TAXON_ID=753684 ORGANISM="Madagascaria erythrocladiodes, Strain CCMP3234" /NCGR_SAMPLE_ID=MMETSP1450 /ASSEMBLY_ACC=CAM_ASM_001115 /LENGTH=80 /DNA_ID=CAMNT_0044040435 /DNA_START=24 /DNA_END=263 /DNA_ORIENTATION=-
MSSRARKADVEDFNCGRREVLVATEAVGVGLNLNINRVLFWDLVKIDGGRRRNFRHLEIRQMAGRAGRYISEFSAGEVCV